MGYAEKFHEDHTWDSQKCLLICDDASLPHGTNAITTLSQGYFVTAVGRQQQ